MPATAWKAGNYAAWENDGAMAYGRIDTVDREAAAPVATLAVVFTTSPLAPAEQAARPKHQHQHQQHIRQDGRDLAQLERPQRVAKGVVVKDAEGKEVGHLIFKKRELVCKYEVMAGDASLGRLVPNGISHTGLQLEREGHLIAEFTKKPPLSSGLFGHIHVYEEVTTDAFPVLLGALLLWY